MKKTLYLKFILAYILFAIFGFIVVATFVSGMTLDHCKKKEADDLYREATLIANTYATELYNSEVSLESVHNQLKAVGTYLNSDVMILNPSGRVVCDSRTEPDPSKEIYVEGFSPSVTGSSYYTIGNFFGQYESQRLSVLAPIAGGYRIKGYVCINYP